MMVIEDCQNMAETCSMYLLNTYKKISGSHRNLKFIVKSGETCRRIMRYEIKGGQHFKSLDQKVYYKEIPPQPKTQNSLTHYFPNRYRHL